MKICLLTNTPSPHQLPFSRELAGRLAKGMFSHLTTETIEDERQVLGWGMAGEKPEWLQVGVPWCECVRQALEADILVTGIRDVALFQKRNALGKHTFYMSERWFKPPWGLIRILFPRFLRLLAALRVQAQSPLFHYLAIGRFAATDLCRFVTFLNPIRKWAYFVEVVPRAESSGTASETVTVLWCGRFLVLKRVDLLIRAVGELLKEGLPIRLMLVGTGPDEARLIKLADSVNSRQPASGSVERSSKVLKFESSKVEHETGNWKLETRESESHTNALMNSCTNELPITFHPPVPVAKVREYMRQADVYVLPSNGYEGWGAVVNEAMSEGCAVIVGDAAGAGTTLIRDGQNGLLFQDGCWGDLAKKLRKVCDDRDLRNKLGKAAIKDLGEFWSPPVAAERFLSIASAYVEGKTPPDYSCGPLSRFSRQDCS